MWSKERQCARNSRQASSTAANCVLDAGEVFMRPNAESRTTADSRPEPLWVYGSWCARRLWLLNSGPPFHQTENPIGNKTAAEQGDKHHVLHQPPCQKNAAGYQIENRGA